ncbi:TIGR04222 domain-containing membrane protein [Kitasatospora sp. NPDC054939]
MWQNEFFWIPGIVLLGAIAWASVGWHQAHRVPNPLGLPGRGLPLLDVAFLSGGPGRVVDTAVVRAHKTGRVIVSRSGLVTWTGQPPVDAVETAVRDAMGLEKSRDLKSLRREVMRTPAVQEIGDRLADRGLLRNPVGLQRARDARKPLWAVVIGVPALSLLAFLVGGERPAVFAPVVIVAVALISLAVLRVPKGRITPAGRTQLGLVTTGSSPWRPKAGAGVDATTGMMLGAIALTGIEAGLDDQELQQALAEAEQAKALAGGATSTGTSCSGPAVWCGSDSSDSSGSGSGSGSSHSVSCGSSTGCGSTSGSSSSSGCGSSSGSSCSSSSSSCGGGGGCGS